MADITVNDVTPVVDRIEENFVPGGTRRWTLAGMTFGDGALTYPVGGVPVPSLATYGFKKALSYVGIEQPPGDGYLYKFDRANHKVRIYDGGTELVGGTAAPAATTLQMLMVGQ